MKKNVSVFLPCRKGSQRVKNKNIKPFANVNGGLVAIKLNQLAQAKKIDKIYLSTNDEEILEFAAKLSIENLVIDKRPDYLCRNETTTDELIRYVPTLVKSEHILWTHVTSPFIDETDYDEVIDRYFQLLDQRNNDSLMSVTPLRQFIWDHEGPVNYNRNERKWPFTQSIKPLFEVNSGVFISSHENYQKLNDRIGLTPHFYELHGLKAFDIDWEDDFIIAEQLFKTMNSKH